MPNLPIILSHAIMHMHSNSQKINNVKNHPSQSKANY